MPFQLITGTFKPYLGRPDGDSIRFVADTPALLFQLHQRGDAADFNKSNGSIQLRYEGIDTMEKAALQEYSSRATRANLDLAGTQNGSVAARGHILTWQLDRRGRPIAFVFAGEPTTQRNGDSVFVEPADIRTSINVSLVDQGHAYPLLYTSLFEDLRSVIVQAAETARAAAKGIWKADTSGTGARWTGSAKTMQPLFPKLWRRVDKYARRSDFDDARPFAEFLPWLQNHDPRERAELRTEPGGARWFDEVVKATDMTVGLSAVPENIIFYPA